MAELYSLELPVEECIPTFRCAFLLPLHQPPTIPFPEAQGHGFSPYLHA